jgi:hypothetical protein
MKKYLLCLFFAIKCCTLLGSTSFTDSLNDESFRISFLKVNPSFDEANKAHLLISHNKSQNNFNIRFVVPNYCYRYMTTINDYFVIKTAKGDYKFNNMVNAVPLNSDKIFHVMVIGQYIFETTLTTDNFKEIFSQDIKKIEFNFMPNDSIRVGVEKLAKAKKLDELEKHMISLAKRRIEVTIKEPNQQEADRIKVLIKNRF